MRLSWVHYFGGKIAVNGIARGYFSMSWHIYQELKSVLKNTLHDAGVGDKISRVHLHVVPPHAFKPTPGAINVLFSMWEGSKLPEFIADGIRKADVCLVPSEYCKNVWLSEAGVESRVVPLGVSEAMVRDNIVPLRKDDPVGLLFVGSTLPRKGWNLISPATRLAFENDSNGVTVYLKTISDSNRGLFSDGHNYLDTRDLSYEDMRDLYWNSEMFMFPSYGEGFGLPVLEAMAGGCIVVSTTSGGLADFVTRDNAVIIDRPDVEEIDYGVKFCTSIPTVESLASALSSAKALIGTDAGEELRMNAVATAKRLTWKHCADEIIRAVDAI